MSLRVYRSTCVIFIYTTPAIMNSMQVLLAYNHSLGPRLYVSVILGVTTLSLYHLHLSGDSADLLFPVAVHLQAPLSLSTSGYPFWQQQTCPLESSVRLYVEHRKTRRMGPAMSSPQQPCQFKCAFCSSSPHSHRRDPQGQQQDSLSGSSALSPHTTSL